MAQWRRSLGLRKGMLAALSCHGTLYETQFCNAALPQACRSHAAGFGVPQPHRSGLCEKRICNTAVLRDIYVRSSFGAQPHHSHTCRTGGFTAWAYTHR
eukprot:6103005-Karenia_brevis.AAC.1